jgi:hypothetical protein
VCVCVCVCVCVRARARACARARVCVCVCVMAVGFRGWLKGILPAGTCVVSPARARVPAGGEPSGSQPAVPPALLRLPSCRSGQAAASAAAAASYRHRCCCCCCCCCCWFLSLPGNSSPDSALRCAHPPAHPRLWGRPSSPPCPAQSAPPQSRSCTRVQAGPGREDHQRQRPKHAWGRLKPTAQPSQWRDNGKPSAAHDA